MVRLLKTREPKPKLEVIFARHRTDSLRDGSRSRRRTTSGRPPSKLQDVGTTGSWMTLRFDAEVDWGSD
ncbi:MAG: hypothetical protein AUF79_02520 [Crenarchaeota archaeon 13_1_20CM_2_51_8]|nr:MAG: hypothetical protein AUF79_02520 [Crenarchaeota archaeon 13_1_20CM_2_51_8]